MVEPVETSTAPPDPQVVEPVETFTAEPTDPRVVEPVDTFTAEPTDPVIEHVETNAQSVHAPVHTRRRRPWTGPFRPPTVAP